jgi:hypothetical protein
MFITNTCAPSSNFQNLSRKFSKNKALVVHTAPIRAVQMIFAAIPDRKFAAKGAEQQFLFLFFLTNFSVCSQSGYHPWEVAIVPRKI